MPYNPLTPDYAFSRSLTVSSSSSLSLNTIVPRGLCPQSPSPSSHSLGGRLYPLAAKMLNVFLSFRLILLTFVLPSLLGNSINTSDSMHSEPSSLTSPRQAALGIHCVRKKPHHLFIYLRHFGLLFELILPPQCVSIL